MYNGEIDQNISLLNADRVVCVDFDLLYTVKRKFFRKKIIFTQTNSAVIRYLRLNKAEIDVIELCAVGKKKLTEKAHSLISLPYPIKIFDDEDSYKNYLLGRGLYAHFANNHRKYYTKRSIHILEIL